MLAHFILLGPLHICCGLQLGYPYESRWGVGEGREGGCVIFAYSARGFGFVSNLINTFSVPVCAHCLPVAASIQTSVVSTLGGSLPSVVPGSLVLGIILSLPSPVSQSLVLLLSLNCHTHLSLFLVLS